jgi:hypothetical protein
VLALLLVTGPARAGGPFQPPDGVGNPNGADYTGYQVVGYVYGVRHVAASLQTRIFCSNTGGADADDFVVQFYSDFDDPVRPPVAIFDSGALPISDMDFLNTTGATGTPSDLMIGRVLAHDSVKKRNPAIVCQANVETNTGSTLGELTFQPAGKKKKK